MQLKFSWGVGKDMESVARMRDAYRTDVYIHPLDITKVPSAKCNSLHNDVSTWLMDD